jgi:RNA polymerase sigma factor (sigma-70 family)
MLTFFGGRPMLANVVPSLLQHVRRLAAAATSDEQLLADFAARRSEEAFAVLLGRHGSMVLNVCRRILHDAHAAEDVFQATFLVLASRAGAIRRRASLAGFLHGVAYRLAVRARRRRIERLPAAVCDPTAGPVEGLAWKEMLGILDEELARLADRYRAPLALCYLQGRTQDEAARQLGWGLNTLRRRLAQGRRLLEARLRGRGVTLPAALASLLAARSVAVSSPLQAATLAAARAVGSEAVGASALCSAGKAMILFLSTSGRKVGALLAVAALGVAVCFACWARQTEQAPAADVPIRAAPAVDLLPPKGAAVRLGTARYRYGSRIGSMAVSADGKLAAVSGDFWSFAPARVFDLTDGRCLYSLPPPRARDIEAVGLSPDGKILAIQDGKDLSFLDAATGKELRKVRFWPDSGASRSVTNWLTFTPDGKQVAATLMGQAVQLIDVGTGKVTKTFDLAGAARACVFSPDGKLMVTGGYESEKNVYFARLWDVATGKEQRRFVLGHQINHSIAALAFSPDGKMLAGGCWGDGRLRLFAVATGKELGVFPKIGDNINSVAFAPDGKTVAAAGDSVHLYDPITGKERLRIKRQARHLAFSQDGAVLTGAVSGAIYQWNAASGRQLTPTAAQDTGVEQILVSPDGRRVFTTDQDGDLYVWDATGGKPPQRLAGGVERGAVLSPDGRFLAWAVPDASVKAPAAVGRRGYSVGSRVRLFDVTGRRILDRFPAFAGDASAVAFLPDGKTLLTLGGATPTARLWDVASGKERRSFPAPPKVENNPGAVWRVFPFCTTRRAALSPDGRTLAIGPDRAGDMAPEARRAPVRLRDMVTGKTGRELQEPVKLPGASDEPSPREVEDLSGAVFNRLMKTADGRAFSPDGRLLADWALDPYGRSKLDHVYVWEVATGRALATLDPGGRVGARVAAFSPDGRTLATASADGVVRLWEVATWKVRAELRGHRDRVTALTFGPDGRLYTGGLDTVVLVWDVWPRPGPAR